MDNLFYLIYIHKNYIEGICITKKNKVIIKEEFFEFCDPNNLAIYGENFIESELLIKQLGNFLDTHKWREHPISFIIPAEEITFRKINFPFHERKKVEQALPFELEEELIFDLSKSTYSVSVQPKLEQNSEAIVLLMDREILKQIRKLCFKRELLIRNVDSAAYALFRSKINNDSTQNSIKNLFQIYLGGDEAFVNTIKEGKLDEIKIFPNRIPEILNKNFINTKTSLHSFLANFTKYPDNILKSDSDSKSVKIFFQIKEELISLCSQFTLYLRIKNYSTESKIETFGVFGPLIKWDGLIFRKRPFPLPETKAFTERYKKNSIYTDSSEIEKNNLKKDLEKINNKTPDTLQELMVQAKLRQESKEKMPEHISESNTNFTEKINKNQDRSNNLEPVDPQTSILSLIEQKHWGILGDLNKNAEIFLETHKLSLYHERTPWGIFLKRNRVSITITMCFLIILLANFLFQKFEKLNTLKEQLIRTEQQVQSEIKIALPNTSANNVNDMLKELREKINKRRSTIKTSKLFEKREYENLHFLKKVSILLDKDSTFQVDSLEYAPERFSISGTIDSYDSLQILKKSLTDLEQFKGKRILESNRKSPDGIVYKISIELK